ncbi:L-type lectin family protein [Streptomyces lasiicapitis]|uniref:hypothetical protein n=1 Tax=Streptomyces lasiicapitis TaxID=1923961 RepID=UPI00366A39FB
MQFPIVESFAQGTVTNPHWKILGSAQLIDGSLELTPNDRHKSGTAFLDQPFASSLGVTIDFDYSVEGGAGLGDGFSVYLIDGEQTTAPGGTGAGLGYSYTAQPSGAVVTPGVTAGYVGIGFDNVGNFSTIQAGADGISRLPNAVGVRGSGSQREGFRWLTGIQVPGGFRAAWEAGAHVQVSIIEGRLTVRHADKANPNGTLLIDGFDLAGAPGQDQMPATFKLGFAAGTGSATAAHRIRNLTVALPVNMPLEMSGPQTAKSGDRVAYGISVQNLGPNDAPDALVEAAVPAQLSDVEVTCRGENGAICGSGSTLEGLRMPVDLPKGSKAMINLSGVIAPAFEGRFTCTSKVTSPTRANTAEKYTGSVTTDVELPKISVSYVIAGQWPGSGGYVVSYDITLAANEHLVVKWEVSYEVPAGTRVNDPESYWFTVTKDGTDGTVVLTSDEGHNIEPGTPLTFRVQMLYASQADAGDGTLRNIRATEVTRP